MKPEEAIIEKVEHSRAGIETKFQSLAATANVCTMCSLSQNRTHAVFGTENVHAKGMLIGEGPGKTEDATGQPFVGPSGRLLDRVMIKVGLNRDDFYITNIVKCHHRGQKPTVDQINACQPYIHVQIEEVRPKLLILTGASSLQGIVGKALPITKIHGILIDTPFRGVKGIAVFHPSYLIYQEAMEETHDLWKAWEDDWRKVKRYLDEVA